LLTTISISFFGKQGNVTSLDVCQKVLENG